MSRQTLISFTEHRHTRLAASILISVVLVLFMVQAFGKAYRDGGYDFTTYLLSAEALAQGTDPYQTGSPFPYAYPLFLAFVLIPLTWLPYWLANLLWYAGNITAMFGSIVIATNVAGRQKNLRWNTYLLPPVVLALLFMINVIQNHLLNGQVNFVVVFLCLLFARYDRDGRAVPAAAALGAAAAIKLVPLILLVYLALRLRLKCLLFSILFFGLFCVLPVLSAGADLFTYYRQYVDHFVLGKLATGAPRDQIPYTLHGVLLDFFPALGDLPGDTLTAAVVVVVALVVIDRLAISRSVSASGAWTIHLYLIATLLVSPMSETHHFVFVMPAVTLLMVHLLYDKTLPPWPYAIALGLFVVCLHAGRWLGGPVFFIGLVSLLTGVTGLALRQEPPRS